MNKSIILIVGLPGSGKTYLANQLSNENRIFDDITSLDELPTNDNFVITDVNFCDKHILSVAIDKLNKLFPYHSVEIIYFENDPDKCRNNVIYRCKEFNDCRNVEGTIRRFEKYMIHLTTQKKYGLHIVNNHDMLIPRCESQRKMI